MRRQHYLTAGDRPKGRNPPPALAVDSGPSVQGEIMKTQPTQKSQSLEDLFAKFAGKVAWAAGSPVTFGVALLSLIAWAASGPYFDYSQGWQLMVNTGTTITTFLMVFVIQNSQNRDGLAAQIKLDEIIRALTGAKNSMIDLECLSDQELNELRIKFSEIADQARKDETKVSEAERAQKKERAPSRNKRKAPAKRSSSGNRTGDVEVAA
jgi:low affinity Fe/Cu permease